MLAADFSNPYKLFQDLQNIIAYKITNTPQMIMKIIFLYLHKFTIEFGCISLLAELKTMLDS